MTGQDRREARDAVLRMLAQAEYERNHDPETLKHARELILRAR